MARAKKAETRKTYDPTIPPAEMQTGGRQQEIPKGSVWELRSLTNNVLLHEGFTEKSAPHLLRGSTATSLMKLEPGDSTSTQLVMINGAKWFRLVRTA